MLKSLKNFLKRSSIKKKCPLCKEGHLIRKKDKQTYLYNDFTITIMQPGEWCNICKEGFFTDKDEVLAMDILKKKIKS